MKKCLVIIILILAFSFALTGCEVEISRYTRYKSKTKIIDNSIASLSLNNELSGHAYSAFTIGYGKVNDKMYYYVEEKQDNGKYLLKKYDTDTTYLQEYNGIPKVEKEYNYFYCNDSSADGDNSIYVDGKHIDNIAPDNDPGYALINDTSAEYKYFPKNKNVVVYHPVMTTIYVPKGTIVNSYKVQ